MRQAAMGLLYRKMLRLRSLKDKKIGEVSQHTLLFVFGSCAEKQRVQTRTVYVEIFCVPGHARFSAW